MKLFLLGAPCAGKTTLVRPLRETLGCPVLDMDEELVRVNGGTWPDLAVKRALSDDVIRKASRLSHVVLTHSRLDDGQLATLRTSGWVVALLDVPESDLRSRAEQRLVSDGWSNVEWLPAHLRGIEDLRARGAFSYVLDATVPATELVRMVASIMRTAPPQGKASGRVGSSAKFSPEPPKFSPDSAKFSPEPPKFSPDSAKFSPEPAKFSPEPEQLPSPKGEELSEGWCR